MPLACHATPTRYSGNCRIEIQQGFSHASIDFKIPVGHQPEQGPRGRNENSMRSPHSTFAQGAAIATHLLQGLFAYPAPCPRSGQSNRRSLMVSWRIRKNEWAGRGGKSIFPAEGCLRKLQVRSVQPGPVLWQAAGQRGPSVLCQAPFSRYVHRARIKKPWKARSRIGLSDVIVV